MIINVVFNKKSNQHSIEENIATLDRPDGNKLFYETFPTMGKRKK